MRERGREAQRQDKERRDKKEGEVSDSEGNGGRRRGGGGGHALRGQGVDDAARRKGK